MPASPQSSTSRSAQCLRIGLLAALTLLAAWLWSASWRQERTLRAASLAQLQQLARREPDNARVFYYLGSRAQQAGQPEAAYDAFTQAVALNADDEPSWLAAADLAGRLHGSQGEYDLLSLFLSHHFRSAAGHMALGRFYHRRRVYLSAYHEALAAATWAPDDADSWRVAGSEAILAQNYPEAEAALRRAVALHPQDWANLVGLGDALTALRRTKEALACYREAVHLAPQESAAAVSLARALLDRSASAADIEEAQDLLQQTIRQSPHIPLTYLLLGQSYERQSRWKEARAVLEEAGRRDPRLNEVHFELGRVAQKLGDAQTAVQERASYQHRLTEDAQIYALRLRIARAKDDISARLKLAKLYVRSGNLDEAAFQCRQILARHSEFQPARTLLVALTSTLPAHAASLLAQADALRGQRSWAAAQNLYAQVLVRDPASLPAAQGMGLCLLSRHAAVRAFPFLADAVRRDPRLAEAQAALAAMYRDAGFPDEARRRLTLAVQSAPTRADFWHELGQIESQADAYAADSEKALARAVALAPSSSPYRLDLAEQEAANGRNAAAAADYRQAVADAPTDADALSRLAGFLVDTSHAPDQRQEAESLLRRALAQDPSNTYARYKLGRLALDLGDAQGAVSALTVVVARSPDIAEAWYSLGMAQQRLGNTAPASRALARSRQLQQAFQERVAVQEQIGLHPRDPALRLRMARLYANNGDTAKALYEYRATLGLAPGNRHARTEMASLEARLRARGQLPSMRLYTALAAERIKDPT